MLKERTVQNIYNNLMQRYDNAIYFCLEDCYKKPSQAKIDAYHEIVRKVNRYNTFKDVTATYRVVSFNTYSFAIIIRVERNDSVTYELHTKKQILTVWRNRQYIKRCVPRFAYARCYND